MVKDSSLCILLLENWKTTLQKYQGRKIVCGVGERGLVFFSPGTTSHFQSAFLNAYPSSTMKLVLKIVLI